MGGLLNWLKYCTVGFSFCKQVRRGGRQRERGSVGTAEGGRRQERRSAARRRRPWQPEVGQRGLKPHAALTKSSVTATQSQQATLTMGAVTHATTCQPSVRQYVNTSAATRALNVGRLADAPLRSASTSAVSLSTIGPFFSREVERSRGNGELQLCIPVFAISHFKGSRVRRSGDRTPARSSAAVTVI